MRWFTLAMYTLKVSKYFKIGLFAKLSRRMYTYCTPKGECSHAVIVPAQCLVRRRLGRRSQTRAVSAHDLQQACRDVPPVQRAGVRAGRRLLASAGAAVEGTARRRHRRLRLSRAEVQCA